MGRFLTPAILIIIVGALYVTWISPTYGEVQGLQAKQATLKDALGKAQQVKQLESQLQSGLSAITPDQMTHLITMVPDNVDNIRLLIEVNDIAAKDGMTIDGLNIPPKPTIDPGAIGSAQGGYGTFTFGFTAHGTYDQLLTFLDQLAHNLRMVDIQSLSFSAPDKSNTYDYGITLDTYWLQ